MLGIVPSCSERELCFMLDTGDSVAVWSCACFCDSQCETQTLAPRRPPVSLTQVSMVSMPCVCYVECPRVVFRYMCIRTGTHGTRAASGLVM